MPEEERLRLLAISQRIALVQSWLAGIEEIDFKSDLMARDAVAMSLLMIGETARRLDNDTKTRSPEVPWPAIVSLRNRIAHGYETVDHALVWQIAQIDLPTLATAIDRLLASDHA
ncbi:hypothetical protein BH11PSE2_BH11PSE2_18350 [soil metagenome]